MSMAKIDKARQYPVIVDIEDMQTRCYAAMHIAGLTTQDVADYMGRSTQYVHNAIHGNDYFMSVQFLCSFVAICGCTVSDILPFANDELPMPYTYTVPGGGAVRVMTPSPYKVDYSDPEDLKDRRWFGSEQT